jgi:PPM family protein phosphatase
VRINSAGKSDVGRVRSENQDSWFASDVSGLYAVADGMGGLSGGRQASEAAIECARAWEERTRKQNDEGDPAAKPSIPGILGSLKSIAAAANREIQQIGAPDAVEAQMGTTLVILLLNESGYFVENVGDSRAYLIRQGAIHRLTRDHSLVQVMADEGLVDEASMRDHPKRNILTRYLGHGSDAVSDSFFGVAESDDLFLLASDGITMHFSDQELLGLIDPTADRAAGVERLVRAANQAGGEDNATAVLVRVLEAPVKQIADMTVLREVDPGVKRGKETRA